MKSLPTFITQEEFEKLFSSVNKQKHIKKKNKQQYKLAMLLGFEAGMRISEILGLDDRILHLTQAQVRDSSILIMSGKGQKDRVVPRPKRMNKNAVDMLPLTIQRRALQHFFKKLGKEVLDKDIHFHTLRHSFCTHLVNEGRPLHEVQMLAGHSRLDTTGLYLHANPRGAVDGAREVF